MILDCTITKPDIVHNEDIFGSDLGSLKIKMI